MMEFVSILEMGPRNIQYEMLQEDQYIRWLGSKGLFHEIAKPLPAIVGPVQTQYITIPEGLSVGFTSSTPSVCIHEGRRLAIIRGVNYKQAVGGITLFKKKEKKCITQNWFVEFDEDWAPISFKIMRDPMTPRPGAVQGYEDCRLFYSNGKLRASCNFAERPQLIGPNTMNLLCEMATLELSDDGDIEKVYALRGPWSVYHQKNWKPAATVSDPLRWIYSTDPLVLVDPSMATEKHADKWKAESMWRGGSQAIRLGDDWLWVDHRPIIQFDGPRNLYMHRFVLANGELTHVKAYSPSFVFNNYGIEFCAGMAIDHDKVVLSYSIRDAFSLLATCSLDRVMKSLEYV